MRIWTGIVVCATVAVLSAGSGGAEAAATRIGLVDVQKVLIRSVAGVAAREQLEREKATMQKDVDARRTEVEQLRQELEKKGLVLSTDARREKEDTLQRKVRDLRRLADDLEKELQRKEQALTQKILQEVSAVVERVGKEQGYLMILERRTGGVIYGDGEADVTEQIIKAYDQQKAQEKAPASRTPTPAPAPGPAQKAPDKPKGTP
jgi:outer membrane protein